MARPVYSVRFWFVLSAPGAGPYDGPVVPSGFTWVVRDIRMVNQGQHNAVHVSTLTFSTVAGFPIASSPDAFSVAGELYHWQGRAVLETGDQLQANAAGAGWTFVVDGYQLTAT